MPPKGNAMQNPIGLYIHVPFCAQKCHYCDFYSLPPDAETLRAYALALSQAAHPFAGRAADTVYFGGGTPTLAGAAWLCGVLGEMKALFSVSPACEITLEANPETVNLEQLIALRQGGFNRISVGLQTMEDAVLAKLGRRHTAAQGRQAVLLAAQAGFDNISADIMLGLPGQSSEAALQSVREIAALPLQHISAYLLKIEPNTPFGRRADLRLPDEEETAELYEKTVALLGEAGYAQYEISNFARAGYPSRHNLKYWRLEEYLGLGPAAHSFLDGQRFFYPRSLSGFLANPDKRQNDGPGGGAEEYLAMSLRLTEGFDFNHYQTLYGGAELPEMKKLAEKWQQTGLCRLDSERLRLTPKGFLVSNSIIAELLVLAEKAI